MQPHTVITRELVILEALTREPVRKAETQDVSWKAVPSDSMGQWAAPCRLTLTSPTVNLPQWDVAGYTGVGGF